MIGIVVPAHNEEAYLTECIHSLHQAIEKIAHLNLDIHVLFVMDSCSDRSIEIVKGFNIDFIECDFQCVGKTRALGVQTLLDQGATWIACTDADSCVDQNWLLEQVRHQPTDVICGTVEIDQWDHLNLSTKNKYLDHYQDRMGHMHVHGANLSFSREAYLASGGFEPVQCHEDVNLVDRFKTLNLAITWSNKVRVTTSSRLLARAPHGFSSFLQSLNSES